MSHGKPKITIENNVDWEGPPENFVYINDYVTSAGISIPDDPPVGCSCSNCYDSKNGCCAAAFGVKFAYNQNGRYDRCIFFNIWMKYSREDFSKFIVRKLISI